MSDSVWSSDSSSSKGKKSQLSSREQAISKLFKNPVKKCSINKAIAHLMFLKKGCKGRTKYKIDPFSVPGKCRNVDTGEDKVDRQVKLHCRQMASVISEVRKLILRQDWNKVNILLLVLCHPALRVYSTIIVKVCFMLLFSHPKSNTALLEEFVRSSTGYYLDKDIKKFIKVIFALRKSELPTLKVGHYVRKTDDYKVTFQPEFSEL